jgi:hypothetical protein
VSLAAGVTDTRSHFSAAAGAVATSLPATAAAPPVAGAATAAAEASSRGTWQPKRGAICARPSFRLVQSASRHGQSSAGSSTPRWGRRLGAAQCATRTWIVTEFCDGGALADVLCSLRQVVDPSSQEFMVSEGPEV